MTSAPNAGHLNDQMLEKSFLGRRKIYITERERGRQVDLDREIAILDDK